MGQENARLRRFGELSVLSLRGSGYEMGFQHGSLLREEVHAGVVPRFGDYVEFDPQLRQLVFQNPDDGYAYVRASSAGLIKCNTCMNEHGIALGGHLLFSYDTAPGEVGATVISFTLQSGWE
jgi:hypothetical protein